MQRGEYDEKPLAGKTLAMIFMKSSTRTRVSFEVGTYQLGGHALFLSPRDVQLGRGEPIADTARVLSRYVDGIMIRTFAHQDVEELAKYADVPVINGLTDLLHPCQILADLLTVRQHLGDVERQEVRVDRRRQQHGEFVDQRGVSLRLRSRHRVSGGLRAGRPSARARAEGRRRSASSAIRWKRPKGAHVVNTDVWASMGQEEEQKERERAFAGFTVTPELMKRADKDAIFLHCLPAHRGEEVTADVIDGPQSRVWDEAENRLHIQKAIMAVLMGGEASSHESEQPKSRSRRDDGRTSVAKSLEAYGTRLHRDDRHRRVAQALVARAARPSCCSSIRRTTPPAAPTEACSFRDAAPALRGTRRRRARRQSRLGQVARKFKEKFDLPYPLLADDDHTIADKYGVWGEKSMYGRKYMGVLRTTFVIDRNGKIAQGVREGETARITRSRSRKRSRH